MKTKRKETEKDTGASTLHPIRLSSLQRMSHLSGKDTGATTLHPIRLSSLQRMSHLSGKDTGASTLHPIGIETLGGKFDSIIPKNTTLPTRKSQIFSTAEDNQSSVEIHILEGEEGNVTKYTDWNKITLGKFFIEDIPPAPRGVPQIKVTYHIDADGRLKVSAEDLGTGKIQSFIGKESVSVKGGMKIGEKERAKEKEQNLIEGKNAEEWFELGFEAKDPEKQVEYYTKCLKLNPKFAEAWNSKAFALRALGRHEEAIRCFDKALEINPKGGIWWPKGFTLYKCSRYEEAIKCFDNALEEDPNNISAREYKVIASIESEIAKIKSAGVKIPKSDDLIEQAKTELNKNNFERAKELTNKAKKIATERKSQYDSAFKSISEAERILNETKNKGVILSTDLLTKTKQAFDNGDYEESVKSAEELKNRVNNTEIKYREARDCINSAESSIERAGDFGCKTSEADELLNRARTGFDAGNYAQATSDASRSEKVAKEIKGIAKPEIEVDLSEKTFQPNVWEEISLNIFNKGNAHAKDVEIGLSEEVKVKGLEIIRSLNAGEKRDLDVSFKPVEVGRVPLEISTHFKDFDEKEYEEKNRVRIHVGEKRKEYKEAQIEMTIERAIYDPCKRDFIEGRLPRMKEWINRYDPGAYWFAVSIQNNTDKTIEEWDVELESSAALKIKEAKIEGIEIEIPHEAHLNSFKISVPKEYGIVIPKGGAQRVYFKLRAEKPKTTYKISGIFKSAIGEVPIRPKEFKYLCDTGVSPEAVKAELKKTFSEKDAARLANTFRVVQEIRNSYCNTDTTAKDINKEFDLLKMYLNEKEFLDEIEGTQRKINAELREEERLSEKHVEEVKNFCEKFTEMWIARFLR